MSKSLPPIWFLYDDITLHYNANKIIIFHNPWIYLIRCHYIWHRPAICAMNKWWSFVMSLDENAKPKWDNLSFSRQLMYIVIECVTFWLTKTITFYLFLTYVSAYIEVSFQFRIHSFSLQNNEIYTILRKAEHRKCKAYNALYVFKMLITVVLFILHYTEGYGIGLPIHFSGHCSSFDQLIIICISIKKSNPSITNNHPPANISVLYLETHQFHCLA